MSIVKSFAVGNGDMFYIKHGSDNFTIIDCSIPEGTALADMIIEEVKDESKSKGVVRFISTHPDQDHLSGLIELDDAIGIVNFYCVKNEATKEEPTEDFERYCELRDGDKAFHIYRGCRRRWMNEDSDERGSAGINILWPVTSNPEYKKALLEVKNAGSPNNTSCIIKYALNGGASMVWMGDLETEFMERVQDSVELPKIDILFAPHHGRKSGRVPDKWLSQMDPQVIILGEAPSEHLHYYGDYPIITQNSTGDITFQCLTGKVHIYVDSESYSADFLDDDGKADIYGKYIGTLYV